MTLVSMFLPQPVFPISVRPVALRPALSAGLPLSTAKDEICMSEGLFHFTCKWAAVESA